MATTLTALNRVCPYYTMFPLDFPFAQLEGLKPGWVLDPFSGRGTTLFAARMRGLAAVGTDTSPVAIAISRAKLAATAPTAIVALAQRILQEVAPDPAPEGRFWELAYSAATLGALLRLRAGLRDDESDTAAALRAIVLGALHGPRSKHKHSYFSNQAQRTFAPKPGYVVRYWEQHAMLPPDVDALTLIDERARRYYAEAPSAQAGLALLCDARRLPEDLPKFSATVTSPPYFGMRTYVPDQWLRNWFVGGPDRPEYAYAEQLGAKGQAEFVAGLAEVWEQVAARSLPGALLAIRFGALRSKYADPEAMILQSIGPRWRVESVVCAGGSEQGKRQAAQMGDTARAGQSVREVDVRCRLVVD